MPASTPEVSPTCPLRRPRCAAYAPASRPHTLRLARVPLTHASVSGAMLIAMSTWGVFGLCVLGFVLMVLVAPAVRSYGRAAEQVTDMGHKVTADRPEFRKPPDEGSLL